MYCTSSAFLARMRAYIDEIDVKSEGVLSFVEYIGLMRAAIYAKWKHISMVRVLLEA